MPNLFLPEIETYAEKDPLLYEIFYQIQSVINKIPINSGAATPAPVQAVDPVSGLPLTDSSGNPLAVIPSSTNQGTTSSALPSAVIPGNDPSLYLQTDPTGQSGVGLYAFGGVWQKLMQIIGAQDLAGHGAPAKTFLTKGAALIRGLQFDDHGRPTSSFFSNSNDNTGSFGSGNPLSQNGVTTQINVAAHTWTFGGFTMSSNSGAVDPGAFGTYSVYFDDPQYNGGAETYIAVAAGTTTPIAKRGRFFLGTITTAGGGGGSGGGGGNGGLCFSPNTKILTSKGVKQIQYVVEGDEVLSLAGWVRVNKQIVHDFEGAVCFLGNEEFVTPLHRFFRRGEWVRACELFVIEDINVYSKVYNLSIEAIKDDFDERHCYTLENGLIAHNIYKY